MTQASNEIGPGWRTLAGICLVLIALATLVWLDADKVPVQQTVGVGPAAGMRLVAVLVAVLGVAHGVAALRAYLQASEGFEPRSLGHVSVSGLMWVLGGLAGLIALLEFGGGFVLGASWLFVATARAFGQAIGIKSFGLGLALTTAVFLFFTRVLSLSLPTGFFERLLLG